MFCISPEAFDAIDMIRSESKFIVAMMDSAMTRIAQVDQAVVTAPTIGVDHGVQIGMTANHRS